MQNTQILCLFLFLIGCDFSKESRNLKELNARAFHLNEKFKNQKLMTDPEVQPLIDSAKKVFEYQVWVYLDANCSTCFQDLIKWKELIAHILEINPQTRFNFILHAKNLSALKKNLETIQFTLDYIYLDPNNSFPRQYEFVQDKPFNTFLTNDKEEILLIGSPLHSKSILITIGEVLSE